MICPNCGSENTDEATFCKFCGQRFGPRTNNSADAVNNGEQDNTMYGDWNSSDNAGDKNQSGNSQSDYSWNSQQNNADNGWNNRQNGADYGWNNYQNGSWNNQQNQNQNGSWNNQQNPNQNSGWNNYQNGGWNNQQGWSDNGYNNYQNNGYQQPYNNGPKPYNGFAIAALIIGILSILPCCLFPYIGIPMNIVGLVLGIFGYKKPYGRGMAIAAIVVNIFFLVLAIVWLIICFYIYANIDMNDYYQMFEQYMR